MKLEKIYDGDDRAGEMGQTDFDALIRTWTDEQINRTKTSLGMSSAKMRDALAKIPVWNGEIDKEAKPFKAYINGGRWLVRCDCGNVEFVSKTHQYIFCHLCGNDGKGTARNVEFPKDIGAAEKSALKNAHSIEQSSMNTHMAAMLFPSVKWEP